MLYAIMIFLRHLQRGRRFPMRRRLVLMTLLFASCIACSPTYSSLTQALEDMPPPVVESQPPSSESPPAPIPPDEHRLPELLTHEREDAVTALGTLRMQSGCPRTGPTAGSSWLRDSIVSAISMRPSMNVARRSRSSRTTPKPIFNSASH